ncbi:threonine aldolase family protein [Bacillus sp. PS06]|uniref:threonine aldolase family protein n=1 Tax=Bacillus sp. PS06 TaxID=2764176 RepID=UPI00178035C3|nr:GntG family PLP-dependent aldolase [Bacillus sp. PS06]MBD8068567.1 aminotransferase class I/II-fold pyridoxal phosphate-dependent enzyme [Bacillus sp. PS06]
MIDLRSDTVTKPTEEMRRAAYEAEVGDDVYKEDVTVQKLEEVAADMLGKEDALFVTSGTQGNQIAVLSHCVAGNEVLLEADSHIFYYEGGAISAFAGVQPRTIKGIRGAMNPTEIEAAIRDEDIHVPETGLICIENTHNRAGGAIVPLENMRDIYTIAEQQQIPVHLDGARLFNAAVALNQPLHAFSAYSTTVQVCLSKGLGAPIGSIIAGDQAFIKKARKWRKRLGGGLRQVGMIAAPGLVALTSMVERLSEDHQNAQRLANGLKEITGLEVVNQVETNIVLVDVAKKGITSQQFIQLLAEQGIQAVSFGPSVVRFTTHYDVTSEQIDKALQIINKL